MPPVLTALPATLSVTETARLLGVSRQTVTRMAIAGELPAIRLRPVSPRRFREQDVAELRRRIYGEAGEVRVA